MKYTSKLILNWTEYEFGAGGGGGWQPWANTIAYYPLDSVNQLSDLSWNQNTLTKDWTVTFTDNYASFSADGRLNTPINSTPTNQTLIFWMMHESWAWNEQVPIAKWGSNLNNHRWWFYKDSDWNLNVQINEAWTNVTTLTTNTWYMVVQTTEWVWTANCNFKVYINWNTTPVVIQTAPLYNDSNTYICMWWRHTQYNFRWKLSWIIIEDKARTSQEISDYFNQTKSLYWIS